MNGNSFGLAGTTFCPPISAFAMVPSVKNCLYRDQVTKKLAYTFTYKLLTNRRYVEGIE